MNSKKIDRLKSIFFKKDNLQMDSSLEDIYDNGLLNYYSSLAVYHPDTIIVFSTKANIVSIDQDKITRLFGSNIQNTRDFHEFLSKHTYETLKSAFNNALKGNSEKQEVEINRQNNESLFLLLTFIPIKDHNVVEGVYLIISDVTEKERLKNNLMISEKHLNYAQQVAGIGSWEYVIEEDRLYCSDYFYHIFGLKQSDYVSMDSPFKLVHPHDYEDVYEKVKDAIKNGKSYTTQFRIFHGKNKELRYIKVSAEVFFKDNQPYKLVGVIKDESYQIQLENQLVDQNKNTKNIYDNLSSGVWVRESIGGKFRFASKALEEILEIPVSKLYEDPKVWYRMIHPDYHQELSDGIKQLSKGKSLQTIYRLLSGSGKTKWLLEQVVPNIDKDGQIFGLVIDITHEMEVKEKLNYLSNYDELTGLPNQRSLYERLDILCDNKVPCALFYLDIDRFNMINDSLGHAIGDEALKIIAKRFESFIPNNGYLARLSSNDFVIVVENYDEKKYVYHLAEKIIKEISLPFTVQEYELHVTTSIGITFFPEEGKDKLSLLENAHTALYHAKKEGKNNYQLSSHFVDISSFRQYILDRDMRKAVINDEFELYFQPQVEPRKGLVCGAEALIRWNHKEWGILSPGEFIPLAEENHMINAISDWVIQKVCMYLNEWKEKGLPIHPVAINIPPIRFLKKGLVDFVKEQLELYQVNPNYLEFEITESTFLKSESVAVSTIEGLKELGVRIAIDDFGMGYASLESIRNFQPNSLKIDKELIQNITKENSIDHVLISSILQLGKSLEMKVVAEGIEEFEQLKFLKQKDCDLIQGYLFSKPVRVDTYEKILKMGYLKPEKVGKKSISVEKRKFFRFEFPFPIPGEMTIIELNGQKVNVGKTPILINNIGLGGLKIQSSLKLPINSIMKFHINFEILNEKFEVDGELRWIEEEYMEIFSYGISYILSRIIEDRLAPLINRLTGLGKRNERIPDTEFIFEEPHKYFKKKLRSEYND